MTSDPNIYAIGEVALHGGMVYGLVAPGYDMAETVAVNLTSETEGEEPRKFTGTDLSTKLKLMGANGTPVNKCARIKKHSCCLAASSVRVAETPKLPVHFTKKRSL